jgi:hypothetical protein
MPIDLRDILGGIAGGLAGDPLAYQRFKLARGESERRNRLLDLQEMAALENLRRQREEEILKRKPLTEFFEGKTTTPEPISVPQEPPGVMNLGPERSLTIPMTQGGQQTSVTVPQEREFVEPPQGSDIVQGPTRFTGDLNFYKPKKGLSTVEMLHALALRKALEPPLLHGPAGTQFFERDEAGMKKVGEVPRAPSRPINMPGYGLIDPDTQKVLLPEKPGYEIKQDETGEFVYLPKNPVTTDIGRVTPPGTATSQQGVVKTGVKGHVASESKRPIEKDEITWDEKTGVKTKQTYKLNEETRQWEPVGQPRKVEGPAPKESAWSEEKVDGMYRDYNRDRLKAPGDPMRIMRIQQLKEEGITVPPDMPYLSRKQFGEFVKTGKMPEGSGPGTASSAEGAMKDARKKEMDEIVRGGKAIEKESIEEYLKRTGQE